MGRTKPSNIAYDPIKSLGRIASFASFGLFVIIVINYVDAHGRYTTELENQEVLAAQESEQRLRLEKFHSEAERLRATLTEFDQRAIDESELAGVQDQLLNFAKQHGCTIKKASPRGKIARDFEKQPTMVSGNEPSKMNDSILPLEKQFEIHDACLALSIEGDLIPTMAFLEAVKEKPWLVSTRQLVLRRDPTQPTRLSTELELQFSSLHECPNRSAGDLPPRS